MGTISTISHYFLFAVAVLFLISVFSPRIGTFGTIRSRRTALHLHLGLALLELSLHLLFNFLSLFLQLLLQVEVWRRGLNVSIRNIGRSKVSSVTQMA